MQSPLRYSIFGGFGGLAVVPPAPIDSLHDRRKSRDNRLILWKPWKRQLVCRCVIFFKDVDGLVICIKSSHWSWGLQKVCIEWKKRLRIRQQVNLKVAAKEWIVQLAVLLFDHQKVSSFLISFSIYRPKVYNPYLETNTQSCVIEEGKKRPPIGSLHGSKYL